MRSTSTLSNIAAALAAFQGEMHTVAFDATNPFLKNRYASLAQIVKTCAPHLAKHGLAVIQMPTADGLITRILHTSGEWLESCLPYPGSAEEKGKSPAQLMGSNITYMRRYAYSAALGIVADEDTDGNHPAPAPAAKKPAPVQQPAKPAEKPMLAKGSEAYFKALDAVSSARYTIADIEKKYRLSQEVRADFIQASIEAQEANISD
jgi:hypothetical protein